MKIHSKYVHPFIEQLKKDSEFFKQNSLIDYSMLIGIHHKYRSSLLTNVGEKDFFKLKESLNILSKNEVFY